MERELSEQELARERALLLLNRFVTLGKELIALSEECLAREMTMTPIKTAETAIALAEIKIKHQK